MKVTISDKAFTAALAQLKAAEQDVDRLSRKNGEAGQPLLQAKLAQADIERRIEAFASGADTSTGAAGELAESQMRTKSVIDLMVRAADHVERELAGAKARLLSAEHACLRTQAEYHDQAFDQLI